MAKGPKGRGFQWSCGSVIDNFSTKPHWSKISIMADLRRAPERVGLERGLLASAGRSTDCTSQSDVEALVIEGLKNGASPSSLVRDLQRDFAYSEIDATKLIRRCFFQLRGGFWSDQKPSNFHGDKW